MKVKAFYPILNLARVVIFEMRKDHQLSVGLEVDNQIVYRSLCSLHNDKELNGKLYFIFDTTRYYLDWFTAV